VIEASRAGRGILTSPAAPRKTAPSAVKSGNAGRPSSSPARAPASAPSGDRGVDTGRYTASLAAELPRLLRGRVCGGARPLPAGGGGRPRNNHLNERVEADLRVELRAGHINSPLDAAPVPEICVSDVNDQRRRIPLLDPLRRVSVVSAVALRIERLILKTIIARWGKKGSLRPKPGGILRAISESPHAVGLALTSATLAGVT